MVVNVVRMAIWRLIVVSGLLGLTVILAGRVARPAQAGLPTFPRAQDPVIMLGNQFFQFLNLPNADLKLYRYQAGIWEAIPYQIDEKNSSGKFVSNEDGLLDSNDELVFQGGDVGEQAPPEDWVDDDIARANWRYEIHAFNPLEPEEEGWVYLYRSASLPVSPTRYISWDEVSETLAGVTYTAAFDQANFVGLADLTLNGTAIDILDRQKVRVIQEACPPVGACEEDPINEENLDEFISVPPLDIFINGPVRAVGDGDRLRTLAYGEILDFKIEVPLPTVTIPGGTVLDFTDFRYSFDFVDPAAIGFGPMTYYSSQQAGGLAVDGVPETIPTTPLVGWYQHSGVWGGVATILQVITGDAIKNYYLDDSALDPDDTGDQQAFGEAGVRMDDPEGTTTIQTTLYMLPAGTGNVGEAYRDRVDLPLDATAQSQRLGFNNHAYLPIAMKP